MKKMDVTTRNFLRLLRAGAFNRQEPIEPLSAWKWHRLLQLALMHDVEQYVYQGVICCKEQFFVHFPEQLMNEWKNQHFDNESDEINVMISPDRLTNPKLNLKLQTILNEESISAESRQMLMKLVGVTRFIMNAGIPVKPVIETAIFIRQAGNQIDYARMQEWIEELKLRPMTQLIGTLLIRMMHMEPEELPFMMPEDKSLMDKRIQKILKLKNKNTEEWYLSQGKNIFVHTSNPSSLLWHIRQSTRLFRYYPSETLTNFFASFAHSLSHIEE